MKINEAEREVTKNLHLKNRPRNYFGKTVYAVKFLITRIDDSDFEVEVILSGTPSFNSEGSSSYFFKDNLEKFLQSSSE